MSDFFLKKRSFKYLLGKFFQYISQRKYTAKIIRARISIQRQATTSLLCLAIFAEKLLQGILLLSQIAKIWIAMIAVKARFFSSYTERQ